MSKRNEVILVESDDESQLPPTKMPKFNGHASSIKKPFMESDSDSADEEMPPFITSLSKSTEDKINFGLNESSTTADNEPQPANLAEESDSDNLPNNQLPESSSSPYGSSSDTSDMDRKSSLEPISVEEYDASVTESLGLNGNAKEDLEIRDPTQVPAEVRNETRQYLKKHGMMKFLDHYLPTTAAADDILGLILKLGYLPREISDYTQEDNLIRLIQILNMAMKKSLTMRYRLDNFNKMEHLLAKLESAKKIMVITGAGISTSLGIPDFRSSKGFYSQLEHLGLSDPQEVFDLDFFHADPSIFYLIAHMILPPAHKFTPLHAFIKSLQDKGKLLRNYTQNIDNLEGVVGIDPEKVVQCHGSFAFALCVTCGYKVPGEAIFSEIREKEIPYCPKCTPKRLKFIAKDVDVHESYGVMKPDITFFGEPLPRRYHDLIRKDREECDLLICIGTSLKVAPVSEILIEIDDKIPQILLNMDPIRHFNLDISLLGYCDDSAAYLCDKLGWDLPYSDENGVHATKVQDLELQKVDEDNGLYSIKKKNGKKEAKEVKHEDD